MKKLESTWSNMAIVLTLIAVIAGGLLAVVNNATKDTIAAIEAENEAKAVKEVLKNDNIKTTEKEVDGLMLYIAEDGSCVAVKSTDPQNASFGGDLTVMVGFDKTGKILGYSIVKTKETPGLGSKAGDWFQDKVVGKNVPAAGLKVKQDNGDVDAITASTITSRSFLRAINAGYAAAVKAGVIAAEVEDEEGVVNIGDEGWSLTEDADATTSATTQN